MKISLDASEFSSEVQKLVTRLDSLGSRAVREAREIVSDATDKLQEETIARVPIDEGFLQRSVEKKVTGGTVSAVTGTVYIPTNAPASDYAMYMHEGEYELGEISRQKQAKNPKIHVGRKYMERALTENMRQFNLLFISRLRGLFK